MSKQYLWDELLVRTFYSNPDERMGRISFRYKSVHNVWPSEENEKLLRIAKEPWMNKMTVSRFVAACLPKLSRVLWNHKLVDADKIINALKKSKIDTQSNTPEMANTKRQKTMFDKSAKDFARSQMMFAIYKDQIANSNATNAGTRIRIKMAR